MNFLHIRGANNTMSSMKHLSIIIATLLSFSACRKTPERSMIATSLFSPVIDSCCYQHQLQRCCWWSHFPLLGCIPIVSYNLHMYDLFRSHLFYSLRDMSMATVLILFSFANVFGSMGIKFSSICSCDSSFCMAFSPFDPDSSCSFLN